MKKFANSQTVCLCLMAAGALSAQIALSQDILVPPSRGGGIDTNPPPMVHVDIFYDYNAKEMRATLDTNYGIAKLVPLPFGYAFDTRSNYSVLNGKAYNYQYAWNPGGAFSPPPGAAVWIERVSFSPGLENYDGPGNKMENPPRPWTPMLGTAGSPSIWKWYGRMAHCAFAILNPRTNVLTAEFRVYFGDATNGSREAFAEYDDAMITLTWTVDPVPEAPAFNFGALEPSAGSPCQFLNACSFATNSGRVITLHQTNLAPNAGIYDCCLPLTAVPATEPNGGPAPNHAALGSHLEMEFVRLSGPAGASLALWEESEPVPRFMVPVGELNGTNRVQLSASQPEPGCDPFGNITGRHLSVTQPGLYCLGFRVVDTSGNGPERAPVHVPSEMYWIHLQAGTTVHAWSKEANTLTARFAGEPGVNYYLQRSPILGPSALWQNVSPPLRGFDRLQTLRDTGASAGQGFYRLRSSVP